MITFLAMVVILFIIMPVRTKNSEKFPSLPEQEFEH